MRERTEAAERHAAEARAKALECDDQRVKEQWLMVARLWELFAKECREFESMRLRTEGAP